MMASPFAKKQRLVARYARSIRDRTGSQFRSYFWGEEIEFIHRPNAFFFVHLGKRAMTRFFNPKFACSTFVVFASSCVELEKSSHFTISSLYVDRYSTIQLRSLRNVISFPQVERKWDLDQR